MAIDAADLPLLLREAAARPFSGAVLTLGKQDVTVTPSAFAAAARVAGVPIPRPEEIAGVRADHVLDDGALLRALGFERVESLDASAYEGATVVHDLNDPDVAEHLRGAFDVVFDRGTTEHVFSMPKALAAIGRLVREGGRVMHFTPSSNHMDHGFAMISPALFHDYYTSNGYALLRLEVVRHPWQDRHPTIELFGYEPGCLDRRVLDPGSYQVFCVAEKRPGATAQAHFMRRAGEGRGRGLRPIARFRIEGSAGGVS